MNERQKLAGELDDVKTVVGSLVSCVMDGGDGGQLTFVIGQWMASIGSQGADDPSFDD